MPRLIDLLRSGAITPTVYKRLRTEGYANDLNISLEEINRKFAFAGLVYDVLVRPDGTETIAVADGVEISRDDEAEKVITAAVLAAPDDGTVLIAAGTYELAASTLFYLDPGEQNPFHCCIPTYGKNVRLVGEGPTNTVLRLADEQHYEDHPVAMILARAESVMDPGYTSFSVRNMTLDGNRAEQTEWDKDGAALILTGSTREGGIFRDLVLRNSYGSGLYLGNNGSGPEEGAQVSNLVVRNCAAHGIILDTARQCYVGDCLIEDCDVTGLYLNGDETTVDSRGNDNLKIRRVQTINASITMYCVNGVDMAGVTMDTVDCLTSYGLAIRSSQGVYVANSKFTADKAKTNSYGGATYIEGGTDGPADVMLENCVLIGYYGLHGLGGEATSIIMAGGAIDAAHAGIYLGDVEPTIATANLIGTVLRSANYHVDAAEGTACDMQGCFFDQTPVVNGDGTIDNLSPLAFCQSDNATVWANLVAAILAKENLIASI